MSEGILVFCEMAEGAFKKQRLSFLEKPLN